MSALPLRSHHIAPQDRGFYLNEGDPPDQGRQLYRNTVIDDEPQEMQFFLTPRRFSRLSTIDDASTDDEDDLPLRQRQVPGKPATFDDLYDLTDDEEIPIRFSNSLAATTPTQIAHNRDSKRFPSIVIPSPSTWPTIHNYKKGTDDPLLSATLGSPTILSPTPHMLSQLAARTMGDGSSGAPSLDGSLTSEELSNLSCPSTPDVEGRGRGAEWSAPVQLHPQALQTLDSLTGAEAQSDSPVVYVAEMREVEEQRPQLGLDVNLAPGDDDANELSALSVPSPGGFFSTLEPSTRHAWLPAPVEQPSTSIAESFYGVPWAETSCSATPPLEQVIELEYEDADTEGPPTARWKPVTPPKSAKSVLSAGTADLQSTEIVLDHNEYKETYQDELREVSTANIDRTAMWLQNQGSFSDNVDDDNSNSPVSAPLPSTVRTSIFSIDSILPPTPSKSVRFNIESPIFEENEEDNSAKDPSFVESFEHMNTTREAQDAFVHRKTRTEALRLDRKCLFTSHVKRLEGKYVVPKEDEKKASRPTSDFFTGEVAEESDVIATATRQRRALEQVKPIAWNLEATKMLNGGTLLTSPTGKLFPRINDGKILDLGGQATCDWAWQVAIEHPNSTVHTVYTNDQVPTPGIGSPGNHKQMRVPNLWTLPYPNDHFHLVSARNLFSLLKTDKHTPRNMDEYDLCLRECIRVLKPGGYLEFALVDADILGGGRQASALSVEFSFNLKTRGYDCTPTKQWLPRLRRAGFTNVRRAWLSLPLTQNPEREGSTADASHISGLVGSWAWERWMLKLHTEMGKDADRLLEGVPAAMEEGARTGASWRYLSGWARKPM
jgi:SAM-dependent methyltransferase